ncbi:glutathione S-transferase family protein [Pseudorhodobacter turbinis]|uniref:Glutathione S-transferase family protein n=1 Tax=Pseudorhodobacter turbinis TaxID=2500533 RepID=A0A4V1E0U7_9RHOB|nr:glutathione S-transferase family protein [Pseudorhodobacter turbinis]QCO55874.1 glutathione S-transferase family protein [Pseudorhodobacter turbinis]
MKLYYADTTVAIALIIALKEAKLPCDLVRVDFAAGEQTRPEFLAINPKGRVPALVTKQGILTETGALLDYIHALAPEAGLVPDDPFQAAKMRELMYYLASTWHVNHAHKGHGERWADKKESHEDMRLKAPETMRACCAYIEENLLKGPFLLGDRFSLADAYLYVVSGWLKGDGVDVSDYPKLAAFRTEMEKRPSVLAVLSENMM